MIIKYINEVFVFKVKDTSFGEGDFSSQVFLNKVFDDFGVIVLGEQVGEFSAKGLWRHIIAKNGSCVSEEFSGLVVVWNLGLKTLTKIDYNEASFGSFFDGFLKAFELGGDISSSVSEHD